MWFRKKQKNKRHHRRNVLDVKLRSDHVRALRARGLAVMLRTQHNAWIHVLASTAAIVLGLVLRITSGEWIAIVLAIMAVWTAEALNTAIEFLTDVASPAFHPLAQKAKDVAAGAVLITAVGAAVVGALVFGPHIWEWFGAGAVWR